MRETVNPSFSKSGSLLSGSEIPDIKDLGWFFSSNHDMDVATGSFDNHMGKESF